MYLSWNTSQGWTGQDERLPQRQVIADLNCHLQFVTPVMDFPFSSSHYQLVLTGKSFLFILRYRQRMVFTGTSICGRSWNVCNTENHRWCRCRHYTHTLLTADKFSTKVSEVFLRCEVVICGGTQHAVSCYKQ